MQKILLIDGSAVLHRAYHAIPAFTAPDGTPTNALYGFIKMLISMVERFAPDYLCVAYDTAKPTFRKELLPTYQAQRPSTPESYRVQVPLTQQFLEQAHIGYFFKEGYEADDVIATIAKQALLANNLHVYVVTGDKDLLQLVDDRLTVVMPQTGATFKYMDQEAVKIRLGVEPKNVVDYKTLVGDPSDNYPGLKGIGPKTAVELINRYGSVLNIYAHLAELSPKQARLLENKEQEALLSAKLAKLVDNVDIPFNLESTKLANFSPNGELLAFCDRYGLKSVRQQLQRIKPINQQTPASVIDKEEDNQLSFF